MRNYKNNQLVRCPCGNILAGYDGHNLTIRKKGRSVAVASSQANIKITCEDCGRRIDVLLDGQAERPCTIKTDSRIHFSEEGQHEIPGYQQR